MTAAGARSSGTSNRAAADGPDSQQIRTGAAIIGSSTGSIQPVSAGAHRMIDASAAAPQIAIQPPARQPSIRRSASPPRDCAGQPASRPARTCTTARVWNIRRIGAIRLDSATSVSADSPARAAPPNDCARPVSAACAATSNLGRNSSPNTAPNSTAARHVSSMGNTGTGFIGWK